MDLDDVSLQQALRDFETANARVLDLTQRLLRSEEQRKQLADSVERLHLKIAQLEANRAASPVQVAEAGAAAAKELAKKVLARLRRG